MCFLLKNKIEKLQKWPYKIVLTVKTKLINNMIQCVLINTNKLFNKPKSAPIQNKMKVLRINANIKKGKYIELWNILKRRSRMSINVNLCCIGYKEIAQTKLKLHVLKRGGYAPPEMFTANILKHGSNKKHK